MIKEKTINIKVLLPNKYGVESFVKYGDNIDLDIDKLPRGSHVKITAICDNCQKERPMEYRMYVIIFNKKFHYYCKKCSYLDRKITCLNKYGVDNVMKVQENKDKMYKTNIEKYGHMCSAQSESIKPKVLNSIYEKLGTCNVFQSEEILKKVREKKEQKGLQCKDIQKTDYQIYRDYVDKLTRQKKKKLFEDWDGYDYYDNEYIKNNFKLLSQNKNYPSIDHKISCLFGFLNNISPKIIADLENLCVTKKLNNSRKNVKQHDNFLIEIKKQF